MPRSPLPTPVMKMREDYRSKAISPFYSGKWHLFLSLLFALGLVIFGLIQIKIESWWQWLFIPITFIIANIVEYVAHRFLLHQSKFKLAYHEHTLLHHFFFTHEALEIESTQDFHRVLFSPYAVFFFIFIIGLPVFLFLGFIFGQVVGWVSFIVGVSYYALYEVVHTCCHLPDEHWVFGISSVQHFALFE